MRKLTLLLFTLALTACGEGSAFDESFKTSYREKFVATCTVGAEGQIPAGVTVDLDKICTCAADKIMAARSAKALLSDPPTGADELSRVRECAKEIGSAKNNPAG